MVSPARESEAPELNRGEFKERIPAYLVSSHQIDPHNGQPDLETVYSSHDNTTVAQVDPEVNHQGYGSYSPSNGTYLTSHDAAYSPGQHDHSQQATHAAAYATAGDYQRLPPNEKEKKQDGKRICGVALPTFIFSIILALVVIGASIGGAIGGTNATRNAKDAQDAAAASATGAAASSTLTNQPKATSTSSSSSTTTDSNALSVPTTDVVVSFDCDSRSGQNQTMELNGGHLYIYSVECGIDTVSSGDTGIDLFAATTYTFEDCLRVCSTFNYNSGSDTCKGVSFNTGEFLYPTTVSIV
ncbi:hypothetical protein E8E14_001055 [Neopestalotiopsis sp. 37M]|nr:hypothetical protein E8E14_001055 [Neopestalotiopsis sp. 37M]